VGVTQPAGTAVAPPTAAARQEAPWHLAGAEPAVPDVALPAGGWDIAAATTGVSLLFHQLQLALAVAAHHKQGSRTRWPASATCRSQPTTASPAPAAITDAGECTYKTLPITSQ